jgi:hypothetical protein
MQQAIQERRGERGILSERRGPLCERQVLVTIVLARS